MYTGILLRSQAHADYESVDPLVDREVAISQSGIGFGIDRGNGVESFWLNYEVLSKIGAISIDGSFSTSIKTSDLPITFDSGVIQEDVNGLMVNNNLLSNTLSYISSVSATNIIFTDGGANPAYTSIDIAALAQKTRNDIILSVPGVSSVTTNQDGTIIEAEDGTVIGNGDVGVITLSPAQTNGARIYAYTQDTHKNKSMRTSILIP